jgi:hypothetical protein
VLRASDPSLVCLTQANETIKLWYNDEHALTLGIRRVVVISGGVTTTTDYALSAMGANPDHVFEPATGTNFLNPPGTDDQNGTDTNTCSDPAGCGRPMWPALFVTDITGNPANREGDWQFHGVPNNPDDVFGTWKAAVRTVNKDTNTITVTPDADPATNNWNLGAGSDTPPGGFGALANEGYGAEVRWSLANLRDRLGNPLVPGHIYRFEFMVHDGDQNKTGGDSGEACANGVIPANFVPDLTPTPTPIPPTATPVPPTATPTPLPAANTSVTVTCQDSTITKGQSTTCTATVTNTSAGQPNGSPHGTANFTQSSGTVVPDPCTLSVFNQPNTGSCTTVFTPSKTGTATIKASFTSSNTAAWKSAGNSANFSVTVNP